MTICLASHGHDDDSKGSSRNKRAHGELAQKRKTREERGRKLIEGETK